MNDQGLRRIDWFYALVPLLPTVVLGILFAISVIDWHKHNDETYQLAGRLIRGSQEGSVAVLRNSTASTEYTQRWKRTLNACGSLNHSYGQVLWMIYSSDESMHLDPNWDDSFAAQVRQQYVEEAGPIIESLMPLMETDQPIWLPIRAGDANFQLPEVQQSREVAKMLTTAFVHAFHQDELEKALEIVRLQLHLFACNNPSAPTVEVMVQLADQEMIEEAVQQSLQFTKWNSQQLDEISKLFSGPTGAANEIRRSVRGGVIESTGISNLQATPLSVPRTRRLDHSISPPSQRVHYLNQMIRQSSETSSVTSVSEIPKYDPQPPRFSVDQWLGMPMMHNFGSTAWGWEDGSYGVSWGLRQSSVRRFTHAALAVRKFRSQFERWPSAIADLELVGSRKSDMVDVIGNPIEIEVDSEQVLMLRYHDYSSTKRRSANSHLVMPKYTLHMQPSPQD